MWDKKCHLHHPDLSSPFWVGLKPSPVMVCVLSHHQPIKPGWKGDSPWNVGIFGCHVYLKVPPEFSCCNVHFYGFFSFFFKMCGLLNLLATSYQMPFEHPFLWLVSLFLCGLKILLSLDIYGAFARRPVGSNCLSWFEARQKQRDVMSRLDHETKVTRAVFHGDVFDPYNGE